MQVLLIQNVTKLGLRGEIKNVSDGYARNFLFPKKMAKPATNSLIDQVKKYKIEQGLQKDRKRSILESSIAGFRETLVFMRPATGDTLFGSVSAKDIVYALKTKGVDITEKNIGMDHPLKHLGKISVPIIIDGGKRGEITVDVQPTK